MPLSDRCRDIILGSLLGDGSLALNPKYRNARFSFRHSDKQKSYFFWKTEALKEIAGPQSFWPQSKSGRKEFGGLKWRFQSRALPELTELYRFTAHRGKRRVTRRWLNRLSPLSLAVWWFDDGSLVSNSRKGVICTDSFSRGEVEIIRNYLRKVWQVETNIGQTIKVVSGKPRQYYRVYLSSTEELKKWLRIILPYLPVEEMLPKVLLLYRDSQLQQRWISEVVSLAKVSPLVVAEYLAAKKEKWKNFRE